MSRAVIFCALLLLASSCFEIPAIPATPLAPECVPEDNLTNTDDCGCSGLVCAVDANEVCVGGECETVECIRDEDCSPPEDHCEGNTAVNFEGDGQCQDNACRFDAVRTAEECGDDRACRQAVCAVVLDLVQIPAGSFTMGSPERELGRDEGNEIPHEVTLTRPFSCKKRRRPRGSGRR